MKAIPIIFFILSPFLPVTGHASGEFKNIDDFLKQAERSAFHTATRLLIQSFNQVAGDTFREGRFSNLSSMEFTCSVDAGSGSLKECAWAFSGSALKLDADSGSFTLSDQIVTSCKIDVSGLHWLEFVNQVKKAAEFTSRDYTDLIDMRLSGKQKSIYEQLETCLDF